MDERSQMILCDRISRGRIRCGSALRFTNMMPMIKRRAPLAMTEYGDWCVSAPGNQIRSLMASPLCAAIASHSRLAQRKVR